MWFCICLNAARHRLCLKPGRSLLQDACTSEKLRSLFGLPEETSFEDWLKGSPLICIDFGSMGAMGAIADPTHLVLLLIGALKKSHAKGVLLTGEGTVLLSRTRLAAACGSYVFFCFGASRAVLTGRCISSPSGVFVVFGRFLVEAAMLVILAALYANANVYAGCKTEVSLLH